MAKERVVRLSTVNNPFNPILEEESWRSYQTLLLSIGEIPVGCEEFVARSFVSSDLLSEPEEDAEYEQAIDNIVRVDPLNLYKKVVEEIEV